MAVWCVIHKYMYAFPYCVSPHIFSTYSVCICWKNMSQGVFYSFTYRIYYPHSNPDWCCIIVYLFNFIAKIIPYKNYNVTGTKGVVLRVKICTREHSEIDFIGISIEQGVKIWKPTLDFWCSLENVI